MARNVMGWLATIAYCALVLAAILVLSGVVDLPQPWWTLVLVAGFGLTALFLAWVLVPWPRGTRAAHDLDLDVEIAQPAAPRVLATNLARRLIRRRGGTVWVWAGADGLTHTAFRAPLIDDEFERMDLDDGQEAYIATGAAWPARRPVVLQYWPIPPRVVANTSDAPYN